MNLKTKKIIAREFLIFFSTFVIAALGFAGSYGYNSYLFNESKVKKDSVQILTKLADSLDAIYNHKAYKQNQIFYAVDEVFNLPTELNSSSTFFRYLYNNAKERGKIKKIWNTHPEFKEILRSLGLHSPERLEQYVLNNIVTSKDIRDGDTSRQLRNRINNLATDAENCLNSQLDYEQQKSMGVKAFYVSLILLFIPRYLFHAIIASIKILKTKD